MALSINIQYYFLPYNTSELIYQIQIHIMVISYIIGHTLSQINFLDRVQLSIKIYYHNNKCCNYNNIFLIATYILLPIPFFSLLTMIIIPTFPYISIMFSFWILFEFFVMINIGYLYLHQLSFLHYIKYKNNELDTMIRITWNIIWTMLISLATILTIYYIPSPNTNANIVYLIFATNILISIICMVSLIDIDQFPSILTLACLCGDYICGCCYCCCCDFRSSSSSSLSSPRSPRPRSHGRTKVSDVDLDDDEESDIDIQIQMSELNDDYDHDHDEEEKDDIIDIKKMTDDGSGLLKKETKIIWNKLNGNTFEIRPKGYYLSVNGKKRNGATMVASAGSMYDIFEIHGYRVNTDKHGKKYDLDIDGILNTKDLKSNTMKLPYFIIINIMLPIKEQDDDEHELNGMQLTMFAKLKMEYEDILRKNDKMTDSMELLIKFIEACRYNDDKNGYKNALRVTMRVNNLKQASLPFLMKTLIKKGNGKVMQIKDKGNYYIDAFNKYFVIDIDGYDMNKTINSAWNTVQNYLYSMVFDVGFYIGAKEIGDYNEQILMCTQLNKLKIDDLLYQH